MKNGIGKIYTTAILTMLMIAIFSVAYIPVSANPDPTRTHTASVFPTETTLPSVELHFNITNTGDEINRTVIRLPTNVCNSTAVATNESWTATLDESNHAINVTSEAPMSSGEFIWVNFTATWNYVPPGTVTFYVDCYFVNATGEYPSLNNTFIKLNVTFNPQFSATIDRTLVRGGTSYLFNITTRNVASGIGIGTINVTYPSGWTFNALVGYGGSRTWSTVHDSAAKTFKLTGPNLLIGEYVWIQVNMTTRSVTQTDHWNSTAWDIGGTWLGTYDLPVEVDFDGPSVHIDTPSNNARVSGVTWINATITESHLQQWTLTINGSLVASGSTAPLNYSWATTSYADGLYYINVTATDVVGNTPGSHQVSVTVDNTAPQLIEIVLGAFKDSDWDRNCTAIGDTFWIPGGITGIKINATFRDTSTTLLGNVYFNVTAKDFCNNTWIPQSPESSYSISGVNSIPVTINITDDKGNRYVHTWTVSKDLNSPTAPTYTEYELIRGGIIVRGITSTDAESGVANYKVYINGTAEQVTPTQLASSTWQSSGNLSRFSGILVVNLTAYAGKAVNITITAVDNAGLESNATTIYIGSVTEGRWYQIELWPGWNLISSPLVIAPNTSVESFLSVMVTGASHSDVIETMWKYDPSTAPYWFAYIPGVRDDIGTADDGWGYWVKAKAHDVLIVQGWPCPAPPYVETMPPTYSVARGWNLIGYTSVTEGLNATYLQSVAGKYLYILGWDAQNQAWTTVFLVNNWPKNLTPGQGYWIYMTDAGYIVPPPF